MKQTAYELLAVIDRRLEECAVLLKQLTACPGQFAQDRLYLRICFGDKTEMSFTFSSRPVIEEAVLTDMSTGDSKPIKEYGSYEG